MGNKNKYWKGIGELTENPELLKAKESEFAEQLPTDIFASDAAAEVSSSRRDFLKFLGFSVGAAALASCETPVTKTIPYVFKPEEVTPGVANWYASTFNDGNDYCSILVKTREGRPIKIEGNPNSKITKGVTNARVQGSVLSLYDGARFKTAMAKGAAADWKDVDAELSKAIAAATASGKSVRVLTGTVLSPSMRSAIGEFLSKTGGKHISVDAVSQYAIRKSHLNTHDKLEMPTYHFDKAKIIVSFGADFITNWVAPIEHSKGYGIGKKINKETANNLSNHIQIESTLSVTGSNADMRMACKPSEIGNYVVALYNALSGGSLPVNGKVDEKGIAKIAEWLKANKGKSLIVCGVNDVATQSIVNEMNKWLGNYGSTLDIETSSNYRMGNDDDFTSLVKEMNDGKVGALIMYGCNPVYTAASSGFASALSKVDVKVSMNTAPNETTAVCDFVCPDHHYLESWADANPRKGHYSLGQPTIQPLFKTRSAMESFLLWAGNNSSASDYIKWYWAKSVFPMQGKYMDFTSFWNYSLHDGVAEIGTDVMLKMEEGKKEDKKKEETKKEEVKTAVTEEAPKTNKMDVSAAAAMIAAEKSAPIELIIYEKTGLGFGDNANNPWMLEFPDPISKVTWDHYITMNPLDMKGKYAMLERQDMIGDMATITVNGKSATLPVFPQPGQARGTIGISVGYGRTALGKVAALAGGFNAYEFVGTNNEGTMHYSAPVTVSDATGEKFAFACTQQHHTMMGRKIVNETTLATFTSVEKQHWNETEMVTMFDSTGGHTKVEPTKANLWDDHKRLGHHWAMAIDLTACNGCGACVISCQAENNVAVVGKEQVAKTRDMAWIRIDRYYSSDMSKDKAHEEGKGSIDMYLEMENPTFENPKVVFQPVMCQHCNHAPCETVCPVLATNHSSERLNMMTYNRCVGTRYCANNCPYKVRRFNWFNYNGNYRFKDINPTQDELGRMVLNPDVVVRSRGVMEKCSMCVQRVQEGKMKSKVAGEKLHDGAIQTACSQSCPADAIVFGDINDTNSAVAKMAADERMYHLLEEVGIQPNVFYLTKIRNSDEVVSHEKHQNKEEHKGSEEHKEEHKEEKKEHA
jgi:molybdopterin-containing oxidoreductase family iron-sulfur binding subunit